MANPSPQKCVAYIISEKVTIDFTRAEWEISKVIEEFIDFENKNDKNKSGVYMINDFYIGKSINAISLRLSAHICECFYELYKKSSSVNKNKCKQIMKILRTEKLKVKLLSTDVKLEQFYINKYKNDGYPLTNMSISKKFKSIFIEKYC